MEFTFKHNNINVANLQKSLDFYEKALNLKPVKRIDKDDFTIVYLSDGNTQHKLELTWLKAHPQAYNLGENEIHLALSTKDYDAALALHKEMGCVCYENDAMGIYFIQDPDGYWTEILPDGRG